MDLGRVSEDEARVGGQVRFQGNRARQHRPYEREGVVEQGGQREGGAARPGSDG